MATPPGPWPAEFVFQYREALALSRKVATLAQACIEHGIGGTQNDYFLRRWLRLMGLHALALSNALHEVAAQRVSMRLPNWVINALEQGTQHAGEIAEGVRQAQRQIVRDNPNYEAAEIAIDRAWASALLVVRLLQAGPPPAEDDVLDQVRELVETLAEEI